MGSTLVGLLLLSVAPNYAIILVAAGLIGTGSAVFHPEASRVARMASGGKFGSAQAFFQVGGNVAVWFGLPFSLDLYEQANARLHRSGQKNEVVVHHLVSVGTIDERIMAVLASKGNMQQALIDAVNEAKGK